MVEIRPEPQHKPEAVQPEESRVSSKRRRSFVEVDDTQLIRGKKPRPEELDQDMPSVPALPNAASVAKRDRENTTVIVKHLPPNYPEVKVRQFFREVSLLPLSFVMNTSSY